MKRLISRLSTPASMLLSTLLASGVFASSAQAGAISYSFSNPYQKTEVRQSGTLSFFDSALGHLTGVSFTFGGGLDTMIALTNNSDHTEELTATSVSRLFFSSNFAPLDALINTGAPLLTLSTSVSKEVEANKTVSGNRALETRSVNWSPAALSGIYEVFSRGPGEYFNISCRSRSGLYAEGAGGNVTATQSSSGFCAASITYYYDNKVPEPATLALILTAGAGAGAGLARRHRRQG
ncbi:choice-of-anchor E domain-containing protein [Paucibacter sp. APW11]|uniref:Choice-of-anchor E domain-containing protein n=1 Tax=Roseateles aquae TaxID=3077235 RepID=A0ABU3PB06_9BURK|nr:choice-of-anchor E domain-containing protein [Paucibacter sp. APW11]MDT8999754.1 choice-of-anchor E domain-containing protein [Paucibacter sp. APW11]